MLTGLIALIVHSTIQEWLCPMKKTGVEWIAQVS
jgi:hypothetical protein